MNSTNIKEIFKSVLENKLNPKIKLLGDSITHGVGGTGWEQIGNPIVEEFKESPNSYCWANLFRDYMKEKYNATVLNKACSGTTVDFVIDHFSALVDVDDDIIVCTIGTNNRHKYFSEGEKPTRDAFLAEFEQKIKKMYSVFKDSGIPTIFVANIPASKKNEEDGTDYWRIIHMSDINDGYKNLAEKDDAVVFSLYESFSNYCSENGFTVDDLLCDGLHPNDKGYKVMFDLIIDAFGV